MERSKKVSIAVLTVLVLGAAGAGAYYWLSQRDDAVKTSNVAPTPKATPALAAPNVRLTLVTMGLPKPTGIVSTRQKDDTRLFVLDQDGLIRIVSADGQIAPKAFLDIRSKVQSDGEMGLLGLVFSPNYAKDGFFYVNYIDKRGYTLVERYSVTADAAVANPASAARVLQIKQPYTNHNGGDLLFGPDGMLYVAMGDGGYKDDPHGYGQNLGTWFGKMLRLDVTTLPYKVPASNPFVGQAGKWPEIWSYGLRNPWRVSFDRKTQDMYIADVGQGKSEEVNVEPAGTRGGVNYGWRCYEGNLNFILSGCAAKSTYAFPALEYLHTNDRCSITGGYVYRGTKYPALDGIYFYGDFCTGEVFGGKLNASKIQPVLQLRAPFRISAFGEDTAGELYMADYSTGSLYSIGDAANPPRE